MSWIEQFRAALDSSGFADTKIVAHDEGWGILILSLLLFTFLLLFILFIMFFIYFCFVSVLYLTMKRYCHGHAIKSSI